MQKKLKLSSDGGDSGSKKCGDKASDVNNLGIGSR
jgi:hypothetical protein